jgi:hypothetical protein
MRPWGRPRPRQQHPKQVFRSNIRNPHDIHPASHLLASDLMTYTGEQNLFTGSSALFTTLLCAQDTSEVLEHVLVVAKDGCDRVRPVCEVLHGHRSASLKDLGRVAEAAELCAPDAGTSVFFYTIPRRGAPPLAAGYESSSAAAMATAAGATIGEHCGGQIQSTPRWWACGRSANGWGGSLQGDGGRNGVGRAVLFSSSVAALSWHGLCVYAEYMRLPCVAHSHRSACGQAILRPRYLNKNAGTLSRVIIWDNLGCI